MWDYFCAEGGDAKPIDTKAMPSTRRCAGSRVRDKWGWMATKGDARASVAYSERRCSTSKRESCVEHGQGPRSMSLRLRRTTEAPETCKSMYATKTSGAP